MAVHKGGDPTMTKRPRIRDLEPIRQNVLRHLKDAELLLDLRRWAASLAASYNALEEAGKYAAKAGWVIARNVDTGAEAHDSKANIVTELMLKAECSAAAAYTLITSYPYAEGAGLNPLAAIEFRIQSAEKEIRKRGLWEVYEEQKSRSGVGSSRLRQIPSMRQVAMYSRKKKGRWIAPDEIVTEGLARSVYADALRIAKKMQLDE
jgi:hypothetical protein